MKKSNLTHKSGDSALTANLGVVRLRRALIALSDWASASNVFIGRGRDEITVTHSPRNSMAEKLTLCRLTHQNKAQDT